MPGAYTHITMANRAAERVSLEAVSGFPQRAIGACGRWRKFCELGAVSPDYPYLQITSTGAKRWADKMHYERTGDVIKTTLRRLRTMTGVAQDKGLVWLLGYTVHVVMDVTIHPVINEKVGPYAQNKTRHRDCEMNQDVHIFRSLNLSVTLSEHLDTGIKSCRSGDGGLDDDIRDLWMAALMEVHSQEAEENAPDPDAWHRYFGAIVDSIERSGWFEPISRHVLGASGVLYPREDDIDQQYIRNLPTPDGGEIHLDELFERARHNVHDVWAVVARGVLEGDDEFETRIGDWDLDTGRDSNGRLVFW